MKYGIDYVKYDAKDCFKERPDCCKNENNAVKNGEDNNWNAKEYCCNCLNNKGN